MCMKVVYCTSLYILYRQYICIYIYKQLQHFYYKLFPFHISYIHTHLIRSNNVQWDVEIVAIGIALHLVELIFICLRNLQAQFRAASVGRANEDKRTKGHEHKQNNREQEKKK